MQAPLAKMLSSQQQSTARYSQPYTTAHACLPAECPQPQATTTFRNYPQQSPQLGPTGPHRSPRVLHLPTHACARACSPPPPPPPSHTYTHTMAYTQTPQRHRRRAQTGPSAHGAPCPRPPKHPGLCGVPASTTSGVAARYHLLLPPYHHRHGRYHVTTHGAMLRNNNEGLLVKLARMKGRPHLQHKLLDVGKWAYLPHKRRNRVWAKGLYIAHHGAVNVIAR